jgi:hypothetical protein
MRVYSLQFDGKHVVSGSLDTGLSDLRHKLAQEVIIEEDDEGKPFFPRFGEKNIIY